MEKETKKKVCSYCQNPINSSKDHYVQLSTHNREKSPDDYKFYHFQCWADYFNAGVERKVRAYVQNLQSRAVAIFETPAIKQALMQIPEAQLALKMVKTPLTSDVVVPKDVVVKKIIDKRGKTHGTKKRKSKEHPK